MLNRIIWYGLLVMCVICGCVAKQQALNLSIPSEEVFVVDHRIEYSEFASASATSTSIIIAPGGSIICSSGDCMFEKPIRVEASGQIFYGEGNFVLAKSSMSILNPAFWGALPDDNIDDHAAIQKTIDAATRQSGVSSVSFDGGVFQLSKPLVVGRIKNNAFTFFGLTIEGNGNVYDVNTSLSNITVLKADFTDGFVFGLQACRGVRLKNLTLVGLNRETKTLNEVYEHRDQQWNVSGIRHSQYSPYSGIALDPFCEGLPADGGFPGLNHFYIPTPGSSAVTIENCKISGFVAGICISPNGKTQQGDNIIIRDCFIDFVKAGIAICQSQSRSVVVENLTVHDAQIVFDSQSYGAQQGQLPEVSGVLGTQIQWLFTCTSAVAHGHFRNVYCEEINGLGYSTNPYGIYPIHFSHCTFMFRFPEVFGNKRTKSNPALLQGKMVAFDGCYIGYSSPKDAFAPLNFDVTHLAFSNSTLDLPVINSNLDHFEKLHNVHYDNVIFKNIPTQSAIRSGGHVYHIKADKMSAHLLAPGQSVTGQDGTKYSNLTNGYDFYRIDQQVSISVDDAQLEAVFHTDNPGLYQPGDQILTDQPNNQTGIGNHVRTCIGVVKRIENEEVVLSSIAYGLLDGNYTTYCARLPYLKQRTSGDLDSGSRTIQHVMCPIDIQHVWAPGDKINGDGLVKGTYITQVNENTIELSHPATKTIQGVVLEDALLKMEATNDQTTVAGIWKAGDQLQMTNPETGLIQKKICLKSGTMGTSGEPVFRELY